ncbi:MAG: M12 family metallo-peptidase [Lysobacterales bacterium]
MSLAKTVKPLCASLLCIASAPVWAADQPLAAWTLGADRSPATLSSPAAVRAVSVHLRPQAFEGSASSLHLDVFGRQYVFVDGRKTSISDERFSWTGHLLGQADFQAQLTARDGALAGLLSLPEGLFELVPDASGNFLVELDPARFPECAGGVDAEHVATGETLFLSSGSRALQDVGEEIKVLVMYTPAARDAAGGVAQIEAQAQAAVDNANLSFSNSTMRMRFIVAGIELLDGWVEGTSSASTELSLFRNNATAQARRDALNADLVSLLVANLPSACGIGYVMRNVSVGFAPSGYQLTDRDCAVGNLSWAHEHGHNVGFEHDPANGTSPGNASQPWSFGHYVENGGSSYRTVMSYQCPAGGCTRRPYFSNPGVSFNGAPTGIADQRDNARTGDFVADTVANFRVEGFSFRDGFE